MAGAEDSWVLASMSTKTMDIGEGMVAGDGKEMGEEMLVQTSTRKIQLLI